MRTTAGKKLEDDSDAESGLLALSVGGVRELPDEAWEADRLLLLEERLALLVLLKVLALDKLDGLRPSLIGVTTSSMSPLLLSSNILASPGFRYTGPPFDLDRPKSLRKGPPFFVFVAKVVASSEEAVRPRPPRGEEILGVLRTMMELKRWQCCRGPIEAYGCQLSPGF